MNKNARIVLVIVVFIIIGVLAYFLTRSPAPVATTTANQPIATATYVCNAGNSSGSITASYYTGQNGTTGSAAGAGNIGTGTSTPPVPTGYVALTLSDGRTMTLPQTLSADGARYASADGQTVFWNVGNGVTFTENGQQTYMGCIEVAADPGGLPQVYENGPQGFSIRVPADYTPDANYTYTEMGPGKSISGVKFTISTSTSTGTNLGSDSYVSVEQITFPQGSTQGNAQTCSASDFLQAQGPSMTTETITDNGTTYSVASTTGAGAGNRYEEWVYAIPGTNPCIAVRYWIHYGVIENYPAGTVQQFDETALLTQFDAIRRTLTIGQ